MIIQLRIVSVDMAMVMTFLRNVLAQVTGVFLVIMSMVIHLVALKVVFCDRFVIVVVDAFCATITVLMFMVMACCRTLHAEKDY